MMRFVPIATLLCSLASGCTVVAAARVRPVQFAAEAERVDGVDAIIEEVTPGAASARLVVSFHNRSERPVRVLRVRVHWAAGSLEAAVADLELAPGASAERELTVGPEAGDLYALYQAPMRARAEVLEAIAAD